MSNNIITSASQLKLISIEHIRAFAQVNDTVKIIYVSGGENIPCSPGSIEISDVSSDKSIYTKKHTFKIPYITQELTSRIKALTTKGVIAIYNDASGILRVSGSPNFPLSLLYYLNNGVISCSLNGKTDCSDSFLID